MPLVLRAYLPTGELDLQAIESAVAIIQRGGIVALPTETVYGLGANALNAEAVARIFAAKGRPNFNPLIVHVSGVEDARELVSEWPQAAAMLASAFWPGPLSMVLPKRPIVPDVVTGGLGAVAIRVPSHPVARALLAAARLPIAAPSANRSNAISPTTAEHVLASLGDRIDAVLDGGPCRVGIESTVIDLTVWPPHLLRPGGLHADEIEAVIGPLQRAGSVDAGPRASPGMLSRHYAPDAHAILVAANDIDSAVEELPRDARVGGLFRGATRPNDRRIKTWETLGDDPTGFAQGLYAALHRIESARVTHVLLEKLPVEGAWEAVADRMMRAAGPR